MASTIQDPTNTIPQEFHVKVDQEAQPQISESEVCEQLSFMYGHDLFHGFYFNYYRVLNQKVEL